MNIRVDKPINSQNEDILGRKKFINNLVDSITAYKDQSSLTIGLYGKWGSGKTSIINLSSQELKKQGYKVINFNPWNFKGQDELLQCFFKDMYTQLNMIDYHGFFTSLSNFFKHLAKIVSFGKYVPIISPYATIIAPLIKKYGETLSNLTYGKSLEQLKDKISKALNKIDKKLIIFIDDVDRLNDIEICQIFQLVKLVGNFENVIYVLSMDKDVVLSALQNSQKEHAETYIEKIIQFPLVIPEVSPLKIQSVLIENLNSTCSCLNEFLPSRNADLARTGFWQQFATLRDVNRFLNLFNLKFESLKNNIDFHDFCVISLLEIKFPFVYYYIKNNKNILSGNYSPYERDNKKREVVKNSVDKLLAEVKHTDEDDLIFIRESLEFLFPKVSQSDNKFWGYTSYNYQESKIRGFIYVEDNFDNYFQFNENELLYDRNQIADIIENYEKEEFVKFIKNLNENKQLSQFMYYISYYIENKLPLERVTKIINWLMEISSNIKKEQLEYNVFSIDCEIQIAYAIKNYLKKNKSNINSFDFLKSFYSSGSLNLVKVELLRSLQYENGRVNSNSNEKSINPIISIEETIKIETLLKDELKAFVENSDNFDCPEYIQYYYLMKTIDNEICSNLSKKTISEGINVLKFIKNFCTHGQLLTGSGQEIYGFNMNIDEFDTKEVYDILSRDFDPNMDLNQNDNLYKVIYLMSYEKNNIDDHYTIQTVQDYLKEKKAVFHNFSDENNICGEDKKK